MGSSGPRRTQISSSSAGPEVFASSINGEGTLEIEVTHLAADNTISRLIQMVEEAQEKQAPAQRFVNQFAKYYTPAVVFLAALVASSDVTPVGSNAALAVSDKALLGSKHALFVSRMTPVGQLNVIPASGCRQVPNRVGTRSASEKRSPTGWTRES